MEPSDHLLRTLASVAPGTRVVDLTAGTGRHVVPLAQLGLDVHGVTPDPVDCRRALAAVVGEAEAAQRVTAASPVASGQPDGCAGWVVVVAPTASRVAVLSEAFRILTPGGWVWVETTDPASLEGDAEAAGLVVAEPLKTAAGTTHAIFRRPGAVG